MNPALLLSHFDRLADAPEAIPRLRRFILDLAVRGKLVEQDPNDEPASELLKRIAAEKVRLVKRGEIKPQKPLPMVSPDELSFDLPSGWRAVRLSDISACLDYMRKPINGAERQKRTEGKPQDQLYPYYGATQQQGWIDDYLFDEELVLLGEDGVPFFDPYRSKAYMIDGKTWVNNHAHVFKGILISNVFVVHCLNVFNYTGRVVGATRSKLNQARAIDIPMPLPPLAEQHRIVARVDELMALCDRLVAARKERGSRHVSYDLPYNWMLCALVDLTIVTDPNPSHRYPDYAGGIIPILSTQDFFGEDDWKIENAKLTTESFWKFQNEICAFSDGDIVFARKGRLGLPRFLPPLDRFTFSHTIFLIKPLPGVVPKYLLWLLRRNAAVEWLTDEMNKNTGVPTLGKAKTERLPVPLPPAAEQHRIVAKVDELMALCDRLESSLAEGEAGSRRLLEAVLHEALQPAESSLAAAE